MKMKTRNRCILNAFWFYFRRHFGSTLEALGSILATFWHPETELKSMSIFVQNFKVAGASLSVQGCPGSPARASAGACRSVRGRLGGASQRFHGYLGRLPRRGALARPSRRLPVRLGVLAGPSRVPTSSVSDGVGCPGECTPGFSWCKPVLVNHGVLVHDDDDGDDDCKTALVPWCNRENQARALARA